MFTEDARNFLKKPLTARLSTHSANGYPHTVPVWFMLENDDIIFIAERRTRKIKNIALNPKGAVAIGGDPGDEAGYLIQGELTVEEDPDFAWMKRMTRFYEAPEKAEHDITTWLEFDMVIIRLKPVHTIKVL